MKKHRKRKAKASSRAGRRTKQPATRPRTLEEVVAANLQDPLHAARIASLNRGERFDDPAVSDPNQREVRVHPDCRGIGKADMWLVLAMWDLTPVEPQR